jgi:hypothetical protein
MATRHYARKLTPEEQTQLTATLNLLAADIHTIRADMEFPYLIEHEIADHLRHMRELLVDVQRLCCSEASVQPYHQP